MSIIQMLFSANGRIRRRDYWLWSVAVFVFGYVAEILAYILMSGDSIDQLLTALRQMRGYDKTPFGIAMAVILVILQWPFICLGAKRWHDRNRTCYIAFAIGLAGVAGNLAQAYLRLDWMLRTSPIFWGIGYVQLAVLIWQFVECGCLDGTKGPNKYGPSPKQIPAPADVF